MMIIKIDNFEYRVSSPVSYETIVKMIGKRGRPAISYYSPTTKYGCELIPGDVIHVNNGDVLNVTNGVTTRT